VLQGTSTIASWATTPAANPFVPALIPVLAVIAVGVLWGADRVLRRRSCSDLTSDRPSGGRDVEIAVLGVALVLRLLALPMAPVLSNDIYRYVWDGRVVLSGENPYRLAPEAEELAALRDDLWRQMDHKEVPTVYPPVALGAFAAAAATPAPLVAWRMLLTGVDLGLCVLLLALARTLDLSPWRTIWYAWSPLAVIESAGQGHVDVLAVTAAVAAVLLVVRSRGDGARGGGFRAAAGAGAAAAVGVLAKLGPLLALPLWARQSRRPLVLLLVAGALLVLGLLPVAATVGVPPGLVTYGVRWEFNGPLFEPLWRGLALVHADAWAKGLLDQAKAATGRDSLFDPLYHYAYPQFLAKLVLAGLLAVALVRSLFERRPLAGTGRLFGWALLASATVYPWYLLWVLPWAALARHRAWLLVCALAPLVYLPGLVDLADLAALVHGPGWELFPWFWLVAWGPPALVAAVALAVPAWRWGWSRKAERWSSA